MPPEGPGVTPGIPLLRRFLDRFHGKSLALLIVNVILFALILTMVLVMGLNVYAGGALYPRGGDTLDLRGQQINPETFDALSRKKTGCQILWDVPFQGTTLPNDIRELTVTSLSDEDLEMLKYFPELQTLDGTGCEDHRNLIAFRDQRESCQVLYNVSIGGKFYPQDTVTLSLTGLTAQDAEHMEDLPYLSDVQVSECPDYPFLQQLQQEKPQWNLSYTVALGGQEVSQDTETLEVRDVQHEELTAALTGLTSLKSIHMTNPRIPSEQLIQLCEENPQVEITWDVELFGKTYGIDTVELDLSNTQGATCEEVESVVLSLPNLEKLDMSYCGVDNETMAAYRERQRGNYKVVWTVQLSSKTTCRTDALYFMPIQQGEYYFGKTPGDEYNLRYCEDIICLDLGHSVIKNIDFVEFMPKLKYLILAFTRVQHVDPIVHCQELVYLEVDWSEIKDFTPIAQLKKLEDLGIDHTYPDITPILSMTWLKNVIAVSRSGTVKALLTEHLPNTNLMLESTIGWRKLPNYYAQRDVLGMPYMNS